MLDQFVQKRQIVNTSLSVRTKKQKTVHAIHPTRSTIYISGKVHASISNTEKNKIFALGPRHNNVATVIRKDSEAENKRAQLEKEQKKDERNQYDVQC